MPTIPKFAINLAKVAKSNPKIISNQASSKIKENNISQIQTKKFAKDDMELSKIRREEIRKEMEQSLPKKAKDDLSDTINISNMKPQDKISGYRTGEKVKIYDSNNTSNFVEIVWPANPTSEVLITLIGEKLKTLK